MPASVRWIDPWEIMQRKQRITGMEINGKESDERRCDCVGWVRARMEDGDELMRGWRDSLNDDRR